MENLSNDNIIDERIVKFIKKHHVMTLATVNGGNPYCCALFYAYDSESDLFIFTSDTTTRHGTDMAENSFVAASIVLETKKVGLIQGLQIQGFAYQVNTDGQHEEAAKIAYRAKKVYIKRFPYAVAADLSLWVLQPTFLKLTDNRLGFGKKLYWGEAK